MSSCVSQLVSVNVRSRSGWRAANSWRMRPRCRGPRGRRRTAPTPRRTPPRCRPGRRASRRRPAAGVCARGPGGRGRCTAAPPAPSPARPPSGRGTSTSRHRRVRCAPRARQEALRLGGQHRSRSWSSGRISSSPGLRRSRRSCGGVRAVQGPYGSWPFGLVTFSRQTDCRSACVRVDSHTDSRSVKAEHRAYADAGKS